MLRIQRNHIDIWLLIVILGLMVISVGVVYSASAEWSMLKRGGSESHYLDLHAIKVLLSIAALFIGISIPYSVYKKLTKPALFVAIAFLFVTFILGGEAKGATRWLRFGGLGFQPSELAKFVLLFHISLLLAIKGEQVREWKTGFRPMLTWIGLVTILVLAQPNLSTGMMIFALSLILLFVGRVKLSHLFVVVMTSAVLFTIYIVVMAYVLKRPYQLERIQHFIGQDASGKKNYQLVQGIIAFGNGGLFGVGPGESRQRDLFLPESYNDFIYSIVGEEYGLIGTLAVLAAFAFVMFRGYRIAKHANDEFGRYLAIAITSTITLYALVNASVALGLLPTTGLPMPFISYGGTSLVFSAFAVGVLLNVSSYTDLFPRAAKVSAPTEETSQQSLSPESGLGKVY